MSLVAYENSDSEEDSEVDQNIKVDELKEKVTSPIEQIINSSSSTNSLFTTLPQPKKSVNKEVEEAVDEFLLIREKVILSDKPKKQPIKISVPSLSQFNHDEDNEELKIKPNITKSVGLFNILPPPKGSVTNVKSFVPNVLVNKAATKKKLGKSALAKEKKKVQDKVKKNTEDSDDDDDVEMFDVESWQKVCGRQPKRQKLERQNIAEIELSAVEAAPNVEEPQKPYIGLDNAAFKELVGKSKLKRENIEVIDIHEEEIMPDPDVWKTKALTDPAQEVRPKTEDPVNEVSRKKHHITYLAQQAKAMEQQLKNQWANNRMTKQQTQAKYGF